MDMQSAMRKTRQPLSLKCHTAHMRRYIPGADKAHFPEKWRLPARCTVARPDDPGLFLIRQLQHLIGDGVFHIGKAGFVLTLGPERQAVIICFDSGRAERKSDTPLARGKRHIAMLGEVIRQPL